MGTNYKLQENDTVIAPISYSRLNPKSSYIPESLISLYGENAVSIREFEGEVDYGILCKYAPPKDNCFFILFVDCIKNKRINETELFSVLEHFIMIFNSYNTPYNLIFHSSILDNINNEFEWLEQSFVTFAEEHKVDIRIIL
jgi:hypothetical protein